MKVNLEKFTLARARACMGPKDFKKAGIPRGTYLNVLSHRNIRPETAGRVAKALGVDVTEIIETDK